MLVNVSYNNPEVRKKIDAVVGKPFTLKERLRLRGIGIGNLEIESASVQINNLLILDNNRNLCNIELRPTGIIVGFRSLLESYALVIPYWKLTIYKGDAITYGIYKDAYQLKIRATHKRIHRFIKRIMDEKISYSLRNAPPLD